MAGCSTQLFTKAIIKSFSYTWKYLETKSFLRQGCHYLALWWSQFRLSPCVEAGGVVFGLHWRLSLCTGISLGSCLWVPPMGPFASDLWVQGVCGIGGDRVQQGPAALPWRLVFA